MDRAGLVFTSTLLVGCARPREEPPPPPSTSSVPSAPSPKVAPPIAVQAEPPPPQPPGPGDATLVTAADTGYTLVVDETHAYWLDQHWLVRFTKVDGSLQKADIHDEVLKGLAHDDAHVYLASGRGDTGSLVSLSKRDLTSTTLGPTKGKVRQLAVDDTHVYWTAYGEDVWRVPKAGGSPEIVARGQHDPEAIHVDERSVYWTNTGPRGADNLMDLMVQPKAGGAPRRIFDDCFSIAGDSGAIYCAGRDAVWRVDKGDERASRITPMLTDPPYAVAVSAGQVCWSSLGPGGARRVDGRIVGSDGGAVACVAKGGVEPVVVAADLNEAYALSMDGGQLWWRDARGIHRASLPEARHE